MIRKKSKGTPTKPAKVSAKKGPKKEAEKATPTKKIQPQKSRAWDNLLQPILKKYENKKHPLDYKNRYQLLVMTLLSAQDSDRHINAIAPAFFEKYPSMKELAAATPTAIMEQIKGVRNFGNKSQWLAAIAGALIDGEIPNTMQELTALKGIGRKSASVIIRESGGHAEGIIVDLHVVRVAPRLGIAEGDKPDKIEKQLMEKIDKRNWNGVGMAISFLGREICRPSNPKCSECPINSACDFFKQIRK